MPQNHIKQTQLQSWETLKSEDVYVAEPWIQVSVEEVRLPDGRVINNYHRIKLSDYAVIFAQTADGRIIVERQYRHGIGRVNLLLPGGAIESGEPPLAAAKRELLEETGYAGEDWRFLGCFVASANYGCGNIHVFMVGNVKQVAQPNSGDLEEMEILLMTPEQVIKAVREGEVVALGAVVAIALSLNPLFWDSA